MFENILNQPDAVERLRQDISEGTLPSSLLFSGPSYAGKLSTALELARVLSCERAKAEWNCDCRSCENHRLLLSTNTLLLGGRYFTAEVAACGDTLSRVQNLSGRYLFARSVRKVTRRFDPTLWEGEETKVSKLLPLLSQLEEFAFELGPTGPALPDSEKLNKRVEEAVSLVRKVEDSISLLSIPVGIVRKAAAWAHLKGQEPVKFLILENADRMLEAARNALLKLLEEPPAGVYILLLTSRRSAIIPTILSRVRTYPFHQRKGQAASEVLERIFKVSASDWADLESFFLLFQGVKPSVLRALTIQFYENARKGKELPETLAATLFQERETFRLFLQELLNTLRALLAGKGDAEGLPEARLAEMEEWMGLVRRSLESAEVLNVHPLLLGERLFLRMRRTDA